MSGSFSERKTQSPAEREAQKAFRQQDAKEALSEYQRAQNAFRENFQRLKAERLAREAASNDIPRSGKIPPKSARRRIP
ncbi:MAG: hypothetical protein HY852_27450 [Bradyrhizobium sp.]|uniref:hypothetical protein n=1 Tax=Bradyrhizobium sp. TaxID=376 RepID=UPI0025BBB2CE|nr:hypothetical protein [Bradyrhizobium sp.]MBI5265547.1 hypothetical protein [Bradyrhizobium sp.]